MKSSRPLVYHRIIRMNPFRHGRGARMQYVHETTSDWVKLLVDPPRFHYIHRSLAVSRAG